MAEKQRKGKVRRFLGRLFSALLLLILIAAVYVAAILIQSPGSGGGDSFVVVEDPEDVDRMQAASMSDIPTLSRMFGAPLPAVPGVTPAGESGNMTWDGRNARFVALRYDGLTIAAVRPAAAAQLLRREGLSVSLRGDLTVLGLPAMLAGKDGAHCVYFSNESAAYAVYAPNATEEAFLAVLEKLTWVQ